jgi:hypothetical protein
MNPSPLNSDEVDHAIVVHSEKVDWNKVSVPEAADFALSLDGFRERLGDVRTSRAAILSSASCWILLLLSVVLGSVLRLPVLGILTISVCSQLVQVGYLTWRYSRAALSFKTAEYAAVVKAQALAEAHPV